MSKRHVTTEPFPTTEHPQKDEVFPEIKPRIRRDWLKDTNALISKKAAQITKLEKEILALENQKRERAVKKRAEADLLDGLMPEATSAPAQKINLGD